MPVIAKDESFCPPIQIMIMIVIIAATQSGSEQSPPEIQKQRSCRPLYYSLLLTSVLSRGPEDKNWYVCLSNID